MNSNTRSALVIIAILGFVLMMILAKNNEDAARNKRHPVPTFTCVTEDSPDCVWDCATRGNRTCGPTPTGAR